MKDAPLRETLLLLGGLALLAWPLVAWTRPGPRSINQPAPSARSQTMRCDVEYTSTSPLSFLSLKLGSEDLIHLDEPSAYGEFELALPVDALLIVDAAFTDEGAQALKLEFFPDSRPTRTFSFWGNRRVRENFQPTAND